MPFDPNQPFSSVEDGFDPNKPFQVVEQDAGFDPAKPFTEIGDKPGQQTLDQAKAEVLLKTGELPDQDVVDRMRKGEAVGVKAFAKAAIKRTLWNGGYFDQAMHSAFSASGPIPKIPQFGQGGSTAAQVAKGIANVGISAANAIPTAGTASLLANPIAQAVTSGWLVKQAAQNLPNTVETIRNGTPQQKTEAVVGEALMLAGAGKMLSGSVKASSDMVQAGLNPARAKELASPLKTSQIAPNQMQGETTVGYAGRMMEDINKSIASDALPTSINISTELVNKILDQAENVGKTGTIQPKEIRPGMAIESAPESAVVSPKIVLETQQNLVAISDAVKALRRKAARDDADTATLDALANAEAKAKEVATEFMTARRVWGTTGLQYQKSLQTMRRILNDTLPEAIEVGKQLPMLNQMISDVRNLRLVNAGKDAVKYVQQNMFGIGSFALDAFGNSAVLAHKLPGWAASDAYNLVTGKPATKLASMIEAVASPWDAFHQSKAIRNEIGTTFSGENVRVFHNNKIVDWAAMLPVKLKGAMDSYFGNTFAYADLISSATKEAAAKGLRGAEKDSFVREFMADPPDYAIDSAVELGRQLKFNRKLSQVEEGISNNMGVRLFLDAFPRWSFQFTRWAGEALGMNYGMWKDIVTGKAKPDAVVEYLVDSATGWAGVKMANDVLADHVDWNTMEYVREDGNRIRLNNLAPIGDALMLGALARAWRAKQNGDKAEYESQMLRFKSAMDNSSIAVVKWVSPSGVLSSLMSTAQAAIRSDSTADMLGRELINFANLLVPGQALLAATKSLVDPTVREGFGANIPGVSALLPKRYNVSTGEPLQPKQSIAGVEVPTIRGVPIPGATRVYSQTEKALINHGLALMRPRRSPLLDLPAPDVPNDLKLEYEQLLGAKTKEIIGRAINRPDFMQIPFEPRREVLSDLRNVANDLAKAELQRRHKNYTPPPVSKPKQAELLPRFLKN